MQGCAAVLLSKGCLQMLKGSVVSKVFENRCFNTSSLNTSATFSLERTCFASGRFREAYMAKAIGGIAKGQYVLKKYRKEKVKEIVELFETTEADTRKATQMNALARNFAENLQLERPAVEYGNTFSLRKYTIQR